MVLLQKCNSVLRIRLPAVCNTHKRGAFESPLGFELAVCKNPLSNAKIESGDGIGQNATSHLLLASFLLLRCRTRFTTILPASVTSYLVTEAKTRSSGLAGTVCESPTAASLWVPKWRIDAQGLHGLQLPLCPVSGSGEGQSNP